MLRTSENGSLISHLPEAETSELEGIDGARTFRPEVEDHAAGRRNLATRLPAALNGYDFPPQARSVLAVFCYEAPDSVMGQFVAKTVLALAEREFVIHLFSRRDFELEATGVFC